MKHIALLVLLCGVAIGDNSSAPSRSTATLNNGDTIQASTFNTEFDAIYTEFGKIGTANILADGVGTSEIIDGSIVAADIAAGAVGTSEIEDGSIATADLATSCVTASNIVDNGIGPEDLGASAFALEYSHQGLTVQHWKNSSGADQIGILADRFSLLKHDESEWITTQNVSLTVAPTAGVAALLDRDDTFTIADQTNFYVWIVAKEDGTGVSAVISDEADPTEVTTLLANVDGITAGYSTGWAGMASAVLNEAAGSWDVRGFFQAGDRVYCEKDVVVSGDSSGNDNLAVDLSPEIPTAVADVCLLTAKGQTASTSGNGGIDFLLYQQGPTYASVYVQSAGGDFNSQVEYPCPLGYVYYSNIQASGSVATNIDANGFSIKHLR